MDGEPKVKGALSCSRDLLYYYYHFFYLQARPNHSFTIHRLFFFSPTFMRHFRGSNSGGRYCGNMGLRSKLPTLTPPPVHRKVM